MQNQRDTSTEHGGGVGSDGSLIRAKDLLPVLKGFAAVGFMASTALDDTGAVDAFQTLFAHIEELLDDLAESLE